VEWGLEKRERGGEVRRKGTDMTAGSEERIYCKALTKITRIMKIDKPKAHTLRRVGQSS
jgi:hypothetical protein